MCTWGGGAGKYLALVYRRHFFKGGGQNSSKMVQNDPKAKFYLAFFPASLSFAVATLPPSVYPHWKAVRDCSCVWLKSFQTELMIVVKAFYFCRDKLLFATILSLAFCRPVPFGPNLKTISMGSPPSCLFSTWLQMNGAATSGATWANSWGTITITLPRGTTLNYVHRPPLTLFLSIIIS